MQSDINIHVGNKEPKIYFNEILAQCESGNQNMEILRIRKHCLII